MDIKDLLSLMKIGNSVAEFDEELENYFIETETFDKFISGDCDIVRGDKGTGKTAIYKIIQKNYRAYKTLEDVEVVSGFNIQGNPVFQRIANRPPMTETQYQTLWKAYFLSLIGNWLIDIYGAPFSNETKNLDDTLRYLNLKSIDVSPETIFVRISKLFEKLTNPEALEMDFTFLESGLPVLTPRVEFGEHKDYGEIIYCDDFMSTLNTALTTCDIKVWVLLDRLDEAFQGSPQTEVPALRALLRTYLDLVGFSHLKLKLFLRKDLFRKITSGGFVNLSHVIAMAIDIVWDEEDLLNMLIRRITRNADFVREMSLDGLGDEDIFYRIFPNQVDAGERKSTTFNWIMSRIRDGNDAKPPRNLLDLVNKAREAQLRKEDRDLRNYERGVTLIESESIKRAHRQLSDQRVQDTLIAESGVYAEIIERFRNGKSEHNKDSLCRILSIDESALTTEIQPLRDMGFLESIGQNYKIPLLYRDGLGITQGKAFDV